MNGEIIVSDVLEEIRVLKITLTELLQERDNLIYHICPELRVKYAAEIGDYQYRALYQEIMILELKRRIEIIRAALNREEKISKEDVDRQIENEYQEFHHKVDEEYNKSKQFREEQAQKEEKRKAYEDQWKRQYGEHEDDENKGDNSGTENVTSKSKEKDLPNAKEMYRKIVKKLHPDMNPNATERELELFNRAVKAYEDGDIMTLQTIYNEIYGFDTEILSEEESSEELRHLKERLLEHISKVIREIANIKKEFPYTEKEFLDNPNAVKKKQDAIIRLIQEYENEIIRLNELLQKMNQEMEELQKTGRD